MNQTHVQMNHAYVLNFDSPRDSEQVSVEIETLTLPPVVCSGHELAIIDPDQQTMVCLNCRTIFRRTSDEFTFTPNILNDKIIQIGQEMRDYYLKFLPES